MPRAYSFTSVPGGAPQRSVFELLLPDEHDKAAEPFTFWLRRMNGPERFLADDLTQEMVATYVEGNAELGIAPIPFFGTDVGPVRVSRTLFRIACRLFVMQKPPQGTDPCAVEEIVAMSATRPLMFDGLSEQAMRIQSGLAPQAHLPTTRPEHSPGSRSRARRSCGG